MLSSIFELAGIALIMAMPPILNLALAFSAPENFPADWDNAFTRLMLMGFIFSISLAMLL